MQSPAPVMRRIFAFLVDMIILGVVTFSVQIPFWMSNGTIVITESMFSMRFFMEILVAVVTIAYFTILEYKLGQTLGKMLMKIEVRSQVKEKTVSQFILRNIPRVSTLLLFLDSLYIFKSGSQRFFDKLAATEVVLVEKENILKRQQSSKKK